ncbi:MAG: hypothetical protein C4539_05935 [Ignavibacteriales bacterium]|nr:MAG: hypothetical protein C4539_05935 [Ignavibacteriales bacterium]
MKKRIPYISAVLMLLVAISGCSVFNAIKNISQLKFKLGTVGNFQLNGINISNKSKLQDFNAGDLLKLTSAFANNKMPVTFTLNVEAFNPNASTSSTAQDIVLVSFPWRLLIDDVETITGNIGSPVTVPVSKTIIIPIEAQLDLFRFFGDKGYDKIINLALMLGGSSGSATNIKLVATPTINSVLGRMTYPGELTIISKEFR